MKISPHSAHKLAFIKQKNKPLSITSSMMKAFKNVSSVLSTEVFKRLGWQQFHGTTKEFKDLRESGWSGTLQ